MNALPDNASGTVSNAAGARGVIAGLRSWAVRGLVPHVRMGFLVLAAAGLFTLSAQAGELRGETGLAFDCAAMHLPTQQDVTRLLGTHNFDQTYRARERLVQNVRRECSRGARQVVVQADDRSPPAARTELARTQ